MKRIALIIQYNGTFFSGWQRQKNAISVQEILEKALLKISEHNINTYAAGRTDSGVHAAGQVVHFDIDCVIPAKNFKDVFIIALPFFLRAMVSGSLTTNISIFSFIFALAFIKNKLNYA